jgi:hypothetical protein
MTKRKSSRRVSFQAFLILFSHIISFDWNIHFAELQKRTLEISIKNEKPFMSTEKVYMGEVSLDLSQMDLESPITAAFDLREKHESRFILDRLAHI